MTCSVISICWAYNNRSLDSFASTYHHRYLDVWKDTLKYPPLMPPRNYFPRQTELVMLVLAGPAAMVQ